MILTIKDLGAQLNFQDTWELQESLVAQRRNDEIEDTLLLLEHSPVYTIGRTRDQSSLQNKALLPHPVIEINRGGEGTYHGPGQLVGYAILDLENHGKDLHEHLRKLEECLIITLADYGVQAQRRKGLTGVWIENRKIASLGVGVRRWISLHGFGINVTRESLTGFQSITPCGLEGVSMTSLENELNTDIKMSDFKKKIGHCFQEIFLKS